MSFSNTPAKLPIPDRLVVLTFDDAVSNHATFAAPLLKRHGFGATFYICEFPPDFETNKQQYMTWEQIRSLAEAGFEIGNHTLTHPSLADLDPVHIEKELSDLETRCAQYGIPKPTSFAYPGCATHPAALPLLAEKGYLSARIGSARAYIPGQDSPFLIPSFPCHGEDPAAFYKALEQARDGQIAVLMFHGVPEYTHPWVDTQPERFQEYMAYLAKERFTVIAMRDLARYAAL